MVSRYQNKLKQLRNLNHTPAKANDSFLQYELRLREPQTLSRKSVFVRIDLESKNLHHFSDLYDFPPLII